MAARLQLRVKDKDSGSGLAGVTIRAGVRSQFDYSQFGNFETGKDGTCTIAISEQALPTLLRALTVGQWPTPRSCWIRSRSVSVGNPCVPGRKGGSCWRTALLCGCGGRADGTGNAELRHYSVPVAADGSFQMEDVEPGDYIISFTLSHPAPGPTPGTTLRRGVSKAVAVPPALGSEDLPVDLGTILMPGD